MNGNRLYRNPNDWQTGDVITKTKMNKIELALLAIAKEIIDAAGGDSMTLSERLNSMFESLNNNIANKVDDALNYYTETEVAVSASPENWKLDGTGKCTQDSSYKIVKYVVTPDDMLHLKLSKDSDGVYQWQNGANVPSSLPNQYLVGTPVTTAIDGNVMVPTGATYLIVSQYKTNSTNSVKLVTVDCTMKEKIDELEESVSGTVRFDETQSLTTVQKQTALDNIGAAPIDEAGIPSAVKTALLACFTKVAWIDEHGQDYYDALYAALYEQPSPTPTGYVQSGLIAFWDGINNTGSSHDANASAWVDTINGHVLNIRNNTGVTWGAKYINFAGNNSAEVVGDKIWNTNPDNLTLEVVFQLSQATISTLNFLLTLGATTQISGNNYNGHTVAVFPDNTIGFCAKRTNSYSLTTAINEIYKASATYTGDNVENAYVNGSEVFQSSNVHSLQNPSEQTISIGNNFEKYYPLSGKIYAIRVYNRKLTTAELSQNDTKDRNRYGLGGA